jgi:phosphotransferase system enzyme I (PtsP)
MSPAAIGPVKLMVRSLDVGKLETFMEGLMNLPDGSVRPQLKAYAEAEGISV